MAVMNGRFMNSGFMALGLPELRSMPLRHFARSDRRAESMLHRAAVYKEGGWARSRAERRRYLEYLLEKSRAAPARQNASNERYIVPSSLAYL
jgi:hypothetical protein